MHASVNDLYEYGSVSHCNESVRAELTHVTTSTAMLNANSDILTAL